MAPTREKALTEHDFEFLLEGARRIENSSHRFEAYAIILMAGRLGFRPGELTHFTSSWVDWQRQIITIPEHAPCQKGRDGGLCGYCRQAVTQRTNYSTGASFDELASQYWQPKTPAAARPIPFHFSSRVQTAIELLADEHDGWPYSFSTLQRRLDTALDKAPSLDSDSTSLHGLRATAASYHASRGLDLAAFRSMFGWEDLETARQYLNIDGAMTRRALSNIHS
ncbi:site-specific integrase [Halobacterium sp. KA-6]|uniref:site-specific integrase n=1 Tax=Halobacterium sp. KA-6 TaxID=2896368 RepID=UPI001E500252|nr:site-specific integrase [Halobacterium sp. KA-6]MCD2204531.1 site-specific integrase [Halobacterium sp. KA-6]